MIEHLYIHIPFCPKLCPYCSFFVEVGSRNKNQAFLDALLAELDAAMATHELRLKTVYFGGGTPSALLLDQLEYLFTGLHRRLDFSALEECSLEANPATVRSEKARLLRDVGVTRISLGVQSWDAALLKTLGRVHTDAQAEKTYLTLRAAGFQSVSLDLMFSVPGQTLEQWEATLARTVALAPDHVSAYCLTYEEDTDYFRRLTGGQFRQDDEHDARLFEATMDRLGAAGFSHYEISNHARPGHESRHNAAYWRGANFLGLGPGAFSTVGEERWENVRDTAGYIARLGRGESAAGFREAVPPRMRRAERAAFGIRTLAGLAAEEVAEWSREVAHLREVGLIEESDGRLRLTRRGKLLADGVGATFV